MIDGTTSFLLRLDDIHQNIVSIPKNLKWNEVPKHGDDYKKQLTFHMMRLVELVHKAGYITLLEYFA